MRRLAGVSRREVSLSLCHYEWLPWIDEADLWNGRVIDLMAQFAAKFGFPPATLRNWEQGRRTPHGAA